jgi:GTPase
VALLVIDATQPLERQDQSIADLVLREGRALVVALNKWDLVDDPKALLKDLQYRIDRELAQAKGVPLIPVSALNGHGLKVLLRAIVTQDARWNRRVATAALNRWFQTAVDANPPPLVKGRRIKLRYVTQAKGRPPTFALFGNQLADLPESYLRYLTGSLRDAFDFQGVPVRWRLRQGKNPFAPGA